MKKKVRFNLLDAAILLVAVGLVLSFVFRAELARIVSGAEEAAYTVTFTVVTTPENADALAVGARLTDGDGNVFAGEVTALSPAEGFGARCPCRPICAATPRTAPISSPAARVWSRALRSPSRRTAGSCSFRLVPSSENSILHKKIGLILEYSYTMMPFVSCKKSANLL